MLTVDVVISPDLHSPMTSDVVRRPVLINAGWSRSAMWITAVASTWLSLIIDYAIERIVGSEDISLSVVITTHQIASIGIKKDGSSVSAYTRVEAIIISLCSVGIDTDPFSVTCLAVMDKNVPVCSISIAIHQVVGMGVESHIATGLHSY